MENYLRTHPGVRWTIILLLLLGLVLEGLVISGRLGGIAGGGGGSTNGGQPTATVELSCEVLVAVNLREGPSTEFARKATLPEGTALTARGRNSDVPWLLVQTTDNQEGWVSSFDTQGQPLVQCDGDLQRLPELGPELSAAGTAELQATPTPEPTPAPAPTLTAAPDVRLRQGNGPDLHAARRTFEIAIDGSLNEWGSTSAISVRNAVFRPENWQGVEDLSGIVRAAWDDEFLYLAAQVDDEAIVQESREDRLVRGDALELFWDGDLVGDFDDDRYSADDSQMVFSPGNFADKEPSAWVYRAPVNPGDLRAQISVSARRSERGYTLEIRLPWQGLGVDPAAQPLFGYAIALSDDDSTGSGEQETQVAMTNATPFEHPARWSNFILDP